MASAGLVEVWPDNRSAALVYLAMSTQWRAGAGGIFGLDYGVLPEMWRRCKVPAADRDRVFWELRQIEAAALEAMREARGRR